MTFPLSQRGPSTKLQSRRGRKEFSQKPQLLNGAVKRLQAQPQAANNWQLLSGIKVCQTGGAHLYSSNISPSHQKDLKQKIQFLRNRWDLWTLKALGLKETGKKGSAGQRHQIPLQRQHSKPIPSGESCSWLQILLLPGSPCLLPWHPELISNLHSSKVLPDPHFLLSQTHSKAEGDTGGEAKTPCQKNRPREELESPLPLLLWRFCQDLKEIKTLYVVRFNTHALKT